jgi:hypothetical protein
LERHRASPMACGGTTQDMYIGLGTLLIIIILVILLT